jgi:adenosylcobinamide amidohydrolase
VTVRAAAASHRVVAVVHDGRWLIVDLGAPHRALGWAIVGGGLVTTDVVAWHQVDDEELPEGCDPGALLRARMAGRGLGADAIGLLTSRDVASRVDVTHEGEDDAGTLSARCVATVGLSNALRAGDPPVAHAGAGTINVLCRVSRPLSTEALIECLALAAEARATAVLDARVASVVSGRPASGTGTDCIVVAAPTGSTAAGAFAGKHTVCGHVVGLAVVDAIRAGIARWHADCGESPR